MTGSTPLTLVDLAKLRERFDDDAELLGEIFRIFLSEVPERRTKILAALAAGDLDRLARLAHSLKGVAGTMFAEELRLMAYDLELAARNGDGAQAAHFGAEALELLGRLAGELDAYLAA
jgi:histidine phosphotransfer protein HptB